MYYKNDRKSYYIIGEASYWISAKIFDKNDLGSGS